MVGGECIVSGTRGHIRRQMAARGEAEYGDTVRGHMPLPGMLVNKAQRGRDLRESFRIDGRCA